MNWLSDYDKKVRLAEKEIANCSWHPAKMIILFYKNLCACQRESFSSYKFIPLEQRQIENQELEVRIVPALPADTPTQIYLLARAVPLCEHCCALTNFNLADSTPLLTGAFNAPFEKPDPGDSS